MQDECTDEQSYVRTGVYKLYFLKKLGDPSGSNKQEIFSKFASTCNCWYIETQNSHTSSTKYNEFSIIYSLAKTNLVSCK